MIGLIPLLHHAPPVCSSSRSGPVQMGREVQAMTPVTVLNLPGMEGEVQPGAGPGSQKREPGTKAENGLHLQGFPKVAVPKMAT